MITRRIALTALRIAVVVGTTLNLINQGDHLLAGQHIDWFRLTLNYVVPYCVASYSAARNQMATMDE